MEVRVLSAAPTELPHPNTFNEFPIPGASVGDGALLDFQFKSAKKSNEIGIFLAWHEASSLTLTRLRYFDGAAGAAGAGTAGAVGAGAAGADCFGGVFENCCSTELPKDTVVVL